MVLDLGARSDQPGLPMREAELVPLTFDLYTNKRLGSRAIANWLNERGHRPRRGGLWSFRSVLTILRNRAYVGEIYFRDNWHPAPHSRQVEPDVFEAPRRSWRSAARATPSAPPTAPTTSSAGSPSAT